MKPFLPLALTLPILLSACGGDNNSSSTGSTQLESSSGTTPTTEQEVGKNLRMNLDLAKLQSAGVTADRIVVSITKDEFIKTIEVEHIDYFATAEFSNLALGEYQITVEIFDGETLVAEGTGTGAVSANQLAIIDLRLELMTGGLAVNVCVPDSDTEEFSSHSLEMLVTEEVGFSGIAAGYIAELTDGAVEYKNTLDYGQLNIDDSIQISLGLLNTFSSINETTKNVKADENTIKITVNDTEILSDYGCDQEFTLSLLDTGVLQGEFNEDFTINTVKHIQLMTEILVDGEDYILINDKVTDRNGDSGSASGEPYYRKVNRVIATITFKPVSTGTKTSDVFSENDIATLFDLTSFTQSLELQSYSDEDDFLVLSRELSSLGIQVLHEGSLKAESKNAP
jgi:hypothetical protein